MFAVNYHRPGSLATAAALFADSDDPSLLAGGQSVLPVLKQRLASHSDLIDISRLEELRGISQDGGRLSIGAAETHAAVASSSVVQEHIPGLAGLAAAIGDPAVRHRGTLGGSLANNDPAADYPAAAHALDAIIHTDRRDIGIDDFLAGLFTTSLAPGEIIVKVSFAIPDAADCQKFRNPASRYAMAGVFVARYSDRVRVGVTGVANSGAFRPIETEDALSRDFSEAVADSLALDPSTLLSDIHGSAAYRANLARVMLRRAVTAIA